MVFFAHDSRQLRLSLAWQSGAAPAAMAERGRPGGFGARLAGLARAAHGLRAGAESGCTRKRLAQLLHLLLFSGFLVLTIGTTLLAIAHDGPYDFHHGWYYLILRADDGRLRRRVYSRLPPRDVSPCFRQAARASAITGATGGCWDVLLVVRYHRLRGGSASPALHAGAGADRRTGPPLDG